MSLLSPIVLAPLAALYGAVTRTRLALYRRELLNVSQLAAPVISVGNITTGGTGKTPLVEFIARALAHQGQRVCVLTRGYGRKSSGRQVLVSDGQSVLADENEAGDEPRLLAEKLQRIAAVISDADRLAAGKWATENLGSQSFILDDGFQHLRLRRNLNIVTIDATQPWGQGHLLPWGRLREPVSGLSRADCVVITRADQADLVSAVRQEVGRLVPNTPLFTSQMIVRGFRSVGENSSMAVEPLTEEISAGVQPIAAFCGIGNPHSFFSQLQRGGYEPVSTTVFADHHRYTKGDVNRIVLKARDGGAHSLITTAKDAVKLRDFVFELPCYALEIEISIADEARFLELLYAAAPPSTAGFRTIAQ